MLEKLQKLGDHDVKGTVQHVAVQDLSRVLADLLQGPERSLMMKRDEKERKVRPETFKYNNIITTTTEVRHKVHWTV